MEIKKLTIALYADAYDDFVGQNADYMSFFAKFGEVILVPANSNVSRVLKTADVLAVPGGADVDPRRYTKTVSFHTGRQNVQYEFLDQELLTPWINDTNKPVIGICRGLQTINVVLGGTLHQHVYNHTGGKNRLERWQNLHTVWDDHKVVRVNSYHHQAIEKLGEGLEMLGWTSATPTCPSLDSKRGQSSFIWLKDNGKKSNGFKRSKSEYGVFPEIIKHNTKPILAFQYHPENYNCPLATTLIKKLLAGDEIIPIPNSPAILGALDEDDDVFYRVGEVEEFQQQ